MPSPHRSPSWVVAVTRPGARVLGRRRDSVPDTMSTEPGLHPGQAGHPPPPAPARRPASPAGPAARSPVLARAAGPWPAARPLTSPALNRQRTAPHSCLADRYEDGGHHASPGGARPTRRPGSQSPQNAGLVKPGRSRSAAQIPAGHRPAVHSASPLDVAGSPDSCQPRATRC